MEEIAPGLHQLDTLLGGIEQLSAGFLVDGPQPALVETGAQTSAGTVLEALAAAGVGPRDLRWVVVTHIHLDHAGAVGDVARAFPEATVVVHQKGARHLVDPERLISSAARVYGPLLDDLYGRMVPVDPDRVVAAGDGLTLDLGGGRRLRLVELARPRPAPSGGPRRADRHPPGRRRGGRAAAGGRRPAPRHPSPRLRPRAGGGQPPPFPGPPSISPGADPLRSRRGSGGGPARGRGDPEPMGGDGASGFSAMSRDRGWRSWPPRFPRQTEPRPGRTRKPPGAGSRSSTGCAATRRGSSATSSGGPRRDRPP